MLLALLLSALQAPLDPQAVRRPNILVLIADDLGWRDVGFNNPATFYETPNLDRLAEGGLVLTAAYAACPVCSPTRASLMTGRHPARLGTTDYFGAPQPDQILEAGEKGQKRLARFQRLPLLPAPYVPQLPLEEVTLAEALKGAGYATYFAGKWHLGGEGFDPGQQGFDVNVAGHHRGGPYGPGKYFHPFDMPNLESEEGDHLPNRLAEETCAFIDEHKDEPWLCYLSFYSVHTPLMGRADLVEKYEAKRARLGLENAWGEEGERRVRLVQEHAIYAAMVEAMDEAVGDVLNKLEALELSDDTIVLFFSDNGGLSTSEGHPTSNLPLRGGKGWLYEGGVREPCAVRWPGRIAAGTTSDLPMQSVDVMPTLLAATGVAPPEGVELDGVDLGAAWTGGVDSEVEAALRQRPLFWHYPHYGNQGGFPGGAVLAGGWKWVERYGAGEDGAALGELYRLADDVEERVDLARAEPERARELAGLLARWRGRVDAKMPRPNPLAQASAK